MSDSSDFNVSDSVVIRDECRREGGRVDREYATSNRLDIWVGFELWSRGRREDQTLTGVPSGKMPDLTTILLRLLS